MIKAFLIWFHMDVFKCSDLCVWMHSCRSFPSEQGWVFFPQTFVCVCVRVHLFTVQCQPFFTITNSKLCTWSNDFIVDKEELHHYKTVLIMFLIASVPRLPSSLRNVGAARVGGSNTGSTEGEKTVMTIHSSFLNAHQSLTSLFKWVPICSF